MWGSGITGLRTERFDRGVVPIGRSGHSGPGGWTKKSTVQSVGPEKGWDPSKPTRKYFMRKYVNRNIFYPGNISPHK